MSANGKGGAAAFHLIVVDDEISVLDVMKETLEGAGWTVDAFSTPAAALRGIKRTRYDALVLDLYMPELPGLLLHSKLKFIDRELWQRTVFVSGHFSTEDLRRSMEGSARFVAKPFKPEALVEIVGQALPEVPRSVSESAAAGRPADKPDRS
jgi:DNA-binding NtrC family response regulator